MHGFKTKMLKTTSIVFTAAFLVLLVSSLFLQATTRLTLLGVGVALVLYLLCMSLIPTTDLGDFYHLAVGVFFFSTLFNIGYELWHSMFYTHFTEPGYRYSELVAMLFGASIGDGLLGLIHLFVVTIVRGGRWQWRWPWKWQPTAFLLVWALIVQIGIEIGALAAGRWSYNSQMPLIPGLGVGLTPAIQMPLLMLPTLWLAQRLLCAERKPDTTT